MGFWFDFVLVVKIGLPRSFVAADVDLDGKVSVEEFDSMIEAAAALPRYIFSSKTTQNKFLKREKKNI